MFVKSMTLLPDAIPEERWTTRRSSVAEGRTAAMRISPCASAPDCGRIYLIEYEVDTIYLDPDDLGRRVGTDLNVSSFVCEGCGTIWPPGAWIGPKAATGMQVRWADLAASRWRWITVRTRGART